MIASGRVPKTTAVFIAGLLRISCDKLFYVVDQIVPRVFLFFFLHVLCEYVLFFFIVEFPYREGELPALPGDEVMSRVRDRLK